MLDNSIGATFAGISVFVNTIEDYYIAAGIVVLMVVLGLLAYVLLGFLQPFRDVRRRRIYSVLTGVVAGVLLLTFRRVIGI